LLVKGNRVEVVVATDEGSRTYDAITTRRGPPRTGEPVRRARLMASRVIALVEHPASEAQGKPATLNDAP
jgi:hypothetical protein